MSAVATPIKKTNKSKNSNGQTELTRLREENAAQAAQIAAIDKSQAVIAFQVDGTILWANHNFLATVGYTLDEIKGRHHSMFVEESYRNTAEYREFWAALARGEY